MATSTIHTKSAEDYTLQVRIGPDYEESNMQIMAVNDEQNPFYLDTPFFEGYFVVRVAHFNGIVPPGTSIIANPPSEYFKGKNRRYSIMMQGKFKKEFNGDDLLFGVEFNQPVRLPTGWQFALKIAQWLDPNMVAVVDTNNPSVFSPLLCAMNSMAIYDMKDLQTGLPPFVSLNGQLEDASKQKKTSTSSFFGFTTSRKSSKVSKDSTTVVADVDQAASDVAKVRISEDTSITSDTNVTGVASSRVSSQTTIESLGKWSFHSHLIQEDVSRIVIKPESSLTEIPEIPTYEKRKKFFSDPNKRSSVTFTTDQVYCMDFYDAYIDFNTVSLKLPGVSLNLFRYWDGQPLRYVIKSRQGEILFSVAFELIEKEKNEEMTDQQQPQDQQQNHTVSNEEKMVMESSDHDDLTATENLEVFNSAENV